MVKYYIEIPFRFLIEADLKAARDLCTDCAIIIQYT